MVQYFNSYGPVDIYLENLPHWRQEGTTYFVTFRLADSLPATTLQQWRAERHAWLAVNPEPWTRVQEQEYYRRFAQRVELWLDSGSCVLSLPAAQELLANALRYFDGQRYALGVFVVAANHVHTIVTPNSGVQLADILHTWKSYTAEQILKQLVYSAAQVIPDTQRLIEQTENQIRLLLGQPPGGVPRGQPLTAQVQPPAVPPGLPSALLERRPDIRSAEQTLIAANAKFRPCRRCFRRPTLLPPPSPT